MLILYIIFLCRIWLNCCRFGNAYTLKMFCFTVLVLNTEKNRLSQKLAIYASSIMSYHLSHNDGINKKSECLKSSVNLSLWAIVLQTADSIMFSEIMTLIYELWVSLTLRSCVCVRPGNIISVFLEADNNNSVSRRKLIFTMRIYINYLIYKCI
jgi:hypothetical protein